MRLDDLLLVGLPDTVEFLADFRRGSASFADVLGPCDLRRFAKDPVNALRDQLVVHVADGRTGAKARRRVALAALGRDPQVGDRALLSLQLGRPLHQLLRLIGGAHDGVDVAMQLDAEPNDWFAGLGDALDDPIGPAFLVPIPQRQQRSDCSRCRSVWK